MYNIRVPVAEESRLVVGNGETMKVQFIGDLDLVMHCNPDVVVTLRDVSYVPWLWYDLMSFSIIQEMHEIRLNKTGAHILDGRVHFGKNRNGNYVQATRIRRGSRGPPAMVAALMRPGRVRSMNINDLHYALGHANEATARATAKQLEIQVAGSLGYCAGCAEGKAIRAAVLKTTSLRATRPLERIFGDLTGTFPPSTGGARYCLVFVDDYSNMGWTLFLTDKSGATVVKAFQAFYASIKPLISLHGPVGMFRSDNGPEFVNSTFTTMLAGMGIGRELTPVDGAKRNGRVERKLALIAEGARSAWLEFPLHFPDLQFPQKALKWEAIWPEAYTWMNDCLNTLARVDEKPDMRCPWVKMYGRRSASRPLPFMMPGVRHTNRQTKAESKGERCFYLNTGNDHSSTAHKVLLSSGITSYTADVTFGYHRRPFVGEMPTWGGGAVLTPTPAPQPVKSAGAGVGSGLEEWSHRQQQQPASSIGGMAAPTGMDAVFSQERGKHRVTPAVTRSRTRVQPPEVSGAFALLATEDELARSFNSGDDGSDTPLLPVDDGGTLEAPETYAEAHGGEHSYLWAGSAQKEFTGLHAVGTFQPAGGS